MPGAATLDLSKKAGKKVVCLEDSEDEEDNMSEISNLSREALIDLIRKQNNNNNKSHSMPSELGDEEISSDLNASNSSSNSSVESHFKQDTADKG